MLHVFKNLKTFTLVYFIVVSIDVLVKINLGNLPYRHFTKPILILLLAVYYYTNNIEKAKKNKIWMYIFFATILIGDTILLHKDKFVFFVVSLIFFSIAKIFLSFRITPRHDFNIIRLLPLSILFFVYTMCIASIVYENMGVLLIPSVICYFLSLLLFQFAVLRRRVFNKFSYLCVMIGVILFTFSESMMAIEIFKTEFPFEKILIVLFYLTALYLIVIGIVNEKEIITEDDTDVTLY